MTPSPRRNAIPPVHRPEPAATDPTHERLGAVRKRYEGSWLQELVGALKAVHVLDWTTIFGAELLWSALPFVILLSSLANDRIDDDLSRHIDLDSRGASIVRGLFRNSPSHAVVPIVTGLLFTFAGVIAVVASLQLLYERTFDLDHRGWRGFPRYLAYVGVLLGVLIAEAAVSGPERRAAGPIVEALVSFVVVAVFFAWTMHFLLAGRVPWRSVIRPAIVTSLLWAALGLFSSAYFSSVVVEDSRTYGTIGVVFSFLTWFMLIGGVVVLGAACGAVWQRRAEGRALGDQR